MSLHVGNQKKHRNSCRVQNKLKLIQQVQVPYKMSEGKVITCRAAVAWAAKEPLSIEEIQVGPPQKGEVRVKILATGVVSKLDMDHLICLYIFGF